jgi:hypothetical protein
MVLCHWRESAASLTTVSGMLRCWAPPSRRGTTDGHLLVSVSNELHAAEYLLVGRRGQLVAVVLINVAGTPADVPWWCGRIPRHWVHLHCSMQ